MTRDLWLHCGTFKSGSSRIQNVAWARRAELLERGWLYPESGLVMDEPDVGYRHSRFVYRYRAPDEWRAMVAALIAEIQASDADHVVMSSEAWSRPSSGTSLTALLTALRDAGCIQEVHGVLYLRNRFDYARSFYREQTRRRDNVHPLPEFVETNARPLDPLDTVTTLRDAIAPGELQVWPYDGTGDTGAHFFGLLGIDVPAAERRENPSIEACEVEAHRQLNLIVPELRDAWPGLSATLPPEVVLDQSRYAEHFDDGQLAATPEWREGFVALSGWTTPQIEQLLRRPENQLDDVTALAGLLRGVVLQWLDRSFVPTVETVLYPHPGVDDLAVDDVDASRARFQVAGCLLPAADAPPGTRLLAIEDTELEAGLGRPSPKFGRRHPDRPEAAAARFAVPRCRFGVHGRIDLVLETAAGERQILATLRRRWEPRT